MAKIKIGNKAPAFTMLNQKCEKVSLKDYAGKKNIVLYFYPKAMTPGCTVQAGAIRDNKRKFTSKNTIVLGVSPDLPERLQRFIDRDKLNFDLLSDPEHNITEKYGFWGLKKFMGKEYMGVIRSTVIIGKDGKIKYIMDKVKTKTHHDDALLFIKENL